MIGEHMKESFKKRKLIYVIFAALVLFLAFMLYGLGQDYEKKDAGKSMVSETPRKFGATYMTMNNPYFQDMNAQIEEIVEANGDILIYRDPAQDQEKQNEQILENLKTGIQEAAEQIQVANEYTKKIAKILLTDPQLPEETGKEIQAVMDSEPFDELRLCNIARHALLAIIGTFPAEWDLIIAPHQKCYENVEEK